VWRVEERASFGATVEYQERLSSPSLKIEGAGSTVCERFEQISI
jgi:hypothetical protein